MDERTLNELLECSVCLDRLDTTSKVLPCQHTFCRRCLEEIVSTKHELRCPECRYLVEMRVEDLPSNILLIRLLEGMKTVNSASGSSSSSSSSSPGKRHLSGAAKASPNKSSLLSQPCARALYNYEAKEQGDLTFKKGDVVLLKKQVDENWFHGEMGGQSGFFPATYVQVITGLPQEAPPKCTALYDFIINDQNEKDCLTFHKDEEITVIRRVDEHWAEGRLEERIGIFPISFVDFNDSAKWLLNNPPSQQLHSSSHAHSNHSSSHNGNHVSDVSSLANQAVATTTGLSNHVATTLGILITTATSPTTTASALMAFATSLNPHTVAMQTASGNAQKRHSLTTLGNQKISLPPSHHRHSMELPLNAAVTAVASNVTTVTTPVRSDAPTGVMTTVTPVVMTTAVEGGSASSRVKTSLPAIFIALYNYKPQKPDEVELVKAGYYTVSEKCQDGWYKGACLRTGRVGVFPGNYVQMVRLSAAMKTSVANAMMASLGSTGLTSRSVNRTHSFPKTSPHHKAPMSAPSSLVSAGEHHRASSQGTVKVPSRTITNVTQAQSRGIAVTSQTLHNQLSPTNGLAATVVTSPLSGSPRVSALIGCGSNDVTNSGMHHISAISRDDSYICSTRASGQSPRAARRHKRASAKEARSKSTVASLSQPLQGGANARSTPPPNIVIGAAADENGVAAGEASSAATKTVSKDKVKEKQEHKDKKERLTLMKRLANHGIPLKGRKSKSPPPQLLSPPKLHSKHQRSGSEGSIVDGGAMALSCIPTPTQKKSEPKPVKVKPLHREKYRCVESYPPQSDIELELKSGDVVYVHKRRDDGWFKGTHTRSGKTGLFPGCFVQKI